MELTQYADSIALHKPYIRPEIYSNQDERISSLDEINRYLMKERGESFRIPESFSEKKQLFRGLLNQRAPYVLPGETVNKINRLLWTEKREEGIVPLESVPELWKGDITRLEADAIVNAANSEMLGCFHPLHACIDNAIHSAAGPQLREDCNKIMKIQGAIEKTGDAKITRAYNLPSKYVLHTVGPIVRGSVTNRHRKLLESCYTSCLELASQLGDIKSIAFCCISTGVFGYPHEDAAAAAIETVEKWKACHKVRFERIIFNVFKEEDYEIYQRYL